jgi:hypothetical protein
MRAMVMTIPDKVSSLAQTHERASYPQRETRTGIFLLQDKGIGLVPGFLPFFYRTSVHFSMDVEFSNKYVVVVDAPQDVGCKATKQ